MARLHPVLTIAITGAIALAISACSKPDEGKAPFAPPAGQTREVFTNQVANISLKVPAMNIDGAMSQTRTTTLQLTPDEPAADGSVNVTATVDFANAQLTGALFPGSEMDMSSVYKAFADGLMGQTISATIGADGNIISTADIEKLAESVNSKLDTKSIPEALGENAEATVKGIFERLLGDDEIRGLIEHVVLPRSLEKLEPGVTWTRQSKVDFGLVPTNASYTYTVKERTETNVTIEEAGTYDLDQGATGLISMFVDNPIVKAMGEASVTLSGTGTGTYVLDSATGWTNSYEGTTALAGKFTVGPLNADLGVNVVQDYTSTFK